MKKFGYRKKVTGKQIFKLFLFTSFFSIGFYTYQFFQNKEKNEQPEVLAITTSTLNVVSQYELGSVIPEICDDLQSRFDFSCYSTARGSRVNSFGGSSSSVFRTTVDFSQRKYYGNPVLEDVAGVPVLFYYGGIHEIALNPNSQKVITLSRTFDTPNNRYTGGCMSSWFPSAVSRQGNTFMYGGTGLEGFTENRCYESQNTGDSNDWGTSNGPNGLKCQSYRVNNGLEAAIPLFAGCTPTLQRSCWDTSFRCKTLGSKFTQYYNYPNLNRITINRSNQTAPNGSILRINSAQSFTGYSSGGAVTRDAKAYCLGKTATGDCTQGFVQLEYGSNPSGVIYLTPSEFVSYQGNTPIRTALYRRFKAEYTKSSNERRMFFNRAYYGVSPSLMNLNSFDFYFGGYSSPKLAWDRNIDLLEIFINYRNINDRYFKYNILNSSMELDPSSTSIGADFTEGITTNRNVNTGVIADFVSEKYFFTLQYFDNSLFLKRFEPTGWGTATTNYQVVSLGNINLSYTKNISFDITSGGDVDFLIAPNFADAESNVNARSRMFRAQGFNNQTGTFRLFELNQNNGGFSFPNPAPGNNTPLTFRYYNTTDSNTTNDYAVFVSKNYVYTSKSVVITSPPTLPPCNTIISNNNLSVVNTHPNSINFGVVPDSVGGVGNSNASLPLEMIFSSPLTLSCPGGNTPVPVGTRVTLTLFDAVNGNSLPATFNALLDDDGKSLVYDDVQLPNYGKYFYKVSFNLNNRIYHFPAVNLDRNLNKYFTIEGFINLNLFTNDFLPANSNDLVDRIEFLDSTMSVRKRLGSTVENYSLSDPSGSSSFSLNSETFENFFWDHNMNVVTTDSSLLDGVTYRLCFRDTASTAVTGVAFKDSTSISTSEVSNNFITATVTNGCLDVRYKVGGAQTRYRLVPQELDIYIRATPVEPPLSYLNFRANGNVMIKNAGDVKMYTTSDSEKKYEGIYISGTSQNVTKNFTLTPELKTNNFKLPYYNFNSQTLVPGFNYTEDLTSIASDSLITTETYLYHLSGRGSSSNLKTINAFESVPANNTPAIIYITRDKKLVFDLTDENLDLGNVFENTYFVSAHGDNNKKQRIEFKVDCTSPNYSYICTNDYSFNIKGGIYGDASLIGRINTRNQRRSFINVIYNPEVLIYLQRDLRSVKIFNVTRSKTIFKYLNN